MRSLSPRCCYAFFLDPKRFYVTDAFIELVELTRNGAHRVAVLNFKATKLTNNDLRYKESGSTAELILEKTVLLRSII